MESQLQEQTNKQNLLSKMIHTTQENMYSKELHESTIVLLTILKRTPPRLALQSMNEPDVHF